MAETKESSKPAAVVAAPAELRLIAVIDVGASAIRMDVAEAGAGGDVHILESLQKPCNLGRDTFAEGRIEPRTVEECVGILQGFRTKLNEYGLVHDNQIRAVATSAVREADNRDQFLDRIFVATNIVVEPIEEPEVHRLTYMALHQSLEQEPSLKQGDVLVVEVGGGGTKVLLIQDGRVTCSDTFRLGSLRVREALDTSNTSEAHTREVIDQQIQRTVEQIRQTVPVSRIPCLIAVIGDFPVSILSLIPGVREHANDQSVKVSLRRLARADRIMSLPIDELVRKYNVSYPDAEAAGPALLSYLRVARAFRVQDVILLKTDLRQGLLLNEAARGTWTERFADQVMHSALALGAKYAFDAQHATHVADLAVRLFRELKDEHHLDQRYEILLRAAALLHEIGTFVSSRSHHKHSMYLIANSELFGLTTRETLLIALVARYHRRAQPLPTHEGYATLDRPGRIIVAKLAAILRVADALDRVHAQRIREIRFARDKDQLVILTDTVDDVTLEALALEQKGDMFASVYGMRVVLRSASLTGDA